MPPQVIRFGISDGKLRAATWKLWTDPKKVDVYLVCRALRGQLKASLHESGQWHVAYSHKFFEDKVADSGGRNQNRFVQTWPRPIPIRTGVILAYRIVTPYSAVTSQIGTGDKQVRWIPNCPAPKATELDVFVISSKTTDILGWPGKQKMGTQSVGSYDLPNGESVWVVYHTIDMPDLSHAFEGGAFRYYKGKSKKDLTTGNYRAIAFGDEPDGSRTMYDFAVTAKIQ